ncbi:hypothetical protein HmCmsJML022_01001 [Escherichia coli]|nr:hypothetical protein HmCmsJML022_01001 [Escherichia coli]
MVTECRLAQLGGKLANAGHVYEVPENNAV